MRRMFLIGILLAIPATAFAQNPGDWVLGNWKGGGYWFPGVVQAGTATKSPLSTTTALASRLL